VSVLKVRVVNVRNVRRRKKTTKKKKKKKLIKYVTAFFFDFNAHNVQKEELWKKLG